MFGNIGIGELIVILGIVLLVFGPRRLPELAASAGKAVRLFKSSLKEDTKTEAAEEK